MLLKAFLVIEEALKMALHQSFEIFPIPSPCTSLETQIITSRDGGECGLPKVSQLELGPGVSHDQGWHKHEDLGRREPVPIVVPVPNPKKGFHPLGWDYLFQSEL